MKTWLSLPAFLFAALLLAAQYSQMGAESPQDLIPSSHGGAALSNVDRFTVHGIWTDRLGSRPSRAYSRLIGPLVRARFLVGGVAVLLVLEFVFWQLSSKRMPTDRTFQLTLISALLDQSLMMAGNLL